MKLNKLYLFVFWLLLSSCEKDATPEKEPMATDCLVQQVISYTTSRGNSQPRDRMKQVFSYDSQNRITQIVRMGMENHTADYEATTTYHYDSKGRVAEIRLNSTYSAGVEYQVTFEYNDQDQIVVRRYFDKWGEKPQVELAKVEYTYAKADELLSSIHYAITPESKGELVHIISKEYAYTNGLMSRVKTYPIDPELQFLPYEDDIRYDSGKAPFSTSPRQLAFMLDFEIGPVDLTFPQHHNVTSVARWQQGGRMEHSYNIHYTFSKEGYPLTARQKYSEGNYVELNYEYSYTCSK